MLATTSGTYQDRAGWTELPKVSYFLFIDSLPLSGARKRARPEGKLQPRHATASEGPK